MLNHADTTVVKEMVDTSEEGAATVHERNAMERRNEEKNEAQRCRDIQTMSEAV